MVSPLLILVAGLGAAFALGLMRPDQARLAYAAMIGALGVMTAIALGWTIALVGGHAPVEIATAGFRPPFAINLRVGAGSTPGCSNRCCTGWSRRPAEGRARR